MTETKGKAGLQSFAQFNLSDNDAASPIVAGFQECNALASKQKSKLLTLKRGVISGSSLEALLGNGDAKVPPKPVTVRSQNEDHSIRLAAA